LCGNDIVVAAEVQGPVAFAGKAKNAIAIDTGVTEAELTQFPAK
jgi:hypothetical protein